MVTQQMWGVALSFALAKLYTYTLARPPSRTLVDPLAAFVQGFQSGLASAVNDAKNAAEATKDIDAKAGRSAYVESDRLKEERVADPGAWGLILILEGLFGDPS
jgi:dihydroxyacetone kinase